MLISHNLKVVGSRQVKGGRRTPVSVANEREGTSVAKQRRGQILPPQPNRKKPALEAGFFLFVNHYSRRLR